MWLGGEDQRSDDKRSTTAYAMIEKCGAPMQYAYCKKQTHKFRKNPVAEAEREQSEVYIDGGRKIPTKFLVQGMGSRHQVTEGTRILTEMLEN